MYVSSKIMKLNIKKSETGLNSILKNSQYFFNSDSFEIHVNLRSGCVKNINYLLIKFG
jgi:hypothetical protein